MNKKLVVLSTSGEVIRFHVKDGAIDLLAVSRAGGDCTLVFNKDDGQPVLLNMKNIVGLELEDLT